MHIIEPFVKVRKIMEDEEIALDIKWCVGGSGCCSNLRKARYEEEEVRSSQRNAIERYEARRFSGRHSFSPVLIPVSFLYAVS